MELVIVTNGTLNHLKMIREKNGVNEIFLKMNEKQLKKVSVVTGFCLRRAD